jgi:chromosome segregation ATPase
MRRPNSTRRQRLDATSSDDDDYADHDDMAYNRSRCRNDKRSKSILRKLRGDLAECDNIQSIHISKLLQEKASIEATNQELITNLKQLRSQLATETATKSDLSVSMKLLESDHARLTKEASTLTTRLNESTNALAKLQTQSEQASLEFKQRKEKHKAETVNLQEEKERYREQVAVLRARVEEGERLVREREDRIREEAERADRAEEREHKVKEEAETWRRNAEEARALGSKMEGEIAELNVRLEYETAGKTDLKERLDALTNELIDKEKTFELQKQDIRSLYEKTLSENEDELKEIMSENSDLKLHCSKSEERVAQLEAVLEQMKIKIEDTTRQLTVTEAELGNLMRDRDSLTEAKGILAERDQELANRKDYSTVGFS